MFIFVVVLANPDGSYHKYICSVAHEMSHHLYICSFNMLHTFEYLTVI